MKIYNFGLDITPGKHKYTGQYFDKLVEKFSPQKTTPYTVEFVEDDLDRAEAVVIQAAKRLDFVFIDLEKIETRLSRVAEESERAILLRAQKLLESESLLCDNAFTPEETALLKELQLVTFKPVVVKDEAGDLQTLIAEVFEKAGVILFFTAGKKEVRAWSLRQGEPILEAAGKIHSDLKRGFIKGDVVNCSELDNFFNMAEARSRGLVQVVDRDYCMQANDIIEIRFNV